MIVVFPIATSFKEKILIQIDGMTKVGKLTKRSWNFKEKSSQTDKNLLRYRFTNNTLKIQKQN